MPDEEAAAVMRQWTAFEPGLPDVVAVRCEFESRREPGDRWGPARMAPQEIPACYFVRAFDTFRSYLNRFKKEGRLVYDDLNGYWNLTPTAEGKPESN